MTNRLVFRSILILVDGILLFAVLYVLSAYRTNVEFVTEYWYRSLLPIGLTWVVLNAVGAYSLSTDMRSLSYTSKHLISMPIAMAATLLFIYAFSYKPSLQFSRSVFPTGFAVFAVLSLGYRRVLNTYMSVIRRMHYFVVLGVDDAARELFRSSKEHRLEQFLLFVDLSKSLEGTALAGEGSPLIRGNALEVLEEIDERCDGIVLAATREMLDDDVFAALVKVRFKNIPVESIKTFYENHFRKIPLFALGKWWVVEDDFLLLQNPFINATKRVSDLLFAVLGFVLALPLMALIALAIRLDTSGPAIFRQRRMGLGEVPFTMYKFRTMVVNSGETGFYTTRNDKRITRVGRLLRATRLDELPQLWNVLKGEMSLIGPRAEWIDIIQSYQEEIPYYHIRHTVKPGITGWAQVNYKYGENIKDTIEKLQYDLFYVSHFSVMLDIDIILKTMYVVGLGKGR